MNKLYTFIRDFRSIIVIPLVLILLSFTACEDNSDQIDPVDALDEEGLFILNEGMFTFGNASLSFYNPSDELVEDQVFFRANNTPLGDVAQSITVHGDYAYLVINNSGIIYKVERSSGHFVEKYSGFSSPRNMLIVDQHKAYVSDLYSHHLSVFDPNGYEYFGRIELGRSSEEMLLFQNKVFVANWSKLNQETNNNMVLVVDVQTDALIDSIEVGIEPNSMELDSEGNLWVLCSGGYDNVEAPTLWKINANSHEPILSLAFENENSNPKDLAINGSADSLYFVNQHLFAMSTQADKLPAESFIPAASMNFYALTVDSKSGDIYVSDALNYMVNGRIYRYSASGRPLGNFQAGIIPGSFAFNR